MPNTPSFGRCAHAFEIISQEILQIGHLEGEFPYATAPAQLCGPGLWPALGTGNPLSDRRTSYGGRGERAAAVRAEEVLRMYVTRKSLGQHAITKRTHLWKRSCQAVAARKSREKFPHIPVAVGVG